MEEINIERIKNKFYAKLQEEKAMKKRRKFPAIIAVAAAFSLMSISVLAYTGVLDFSRIYQIVFGENSEYVEQYIQPLGNEAVVESEYNGIVMRLISAINDEYALRVFATLTDTTGDRLSDGVSFPSWGLSKGHTQGISIVEYNHETRTAVILITSRGGDLHGSATLTVDGIAAERGLSENFPMPENYNLIEGRWEFSFTIPERVATEFRVDREFQIGNDTIMIDMVSLSPLGITIHLPRNIVVEYMATRPHDDTAVIEYVDGSTVELNQVSIHGHENTSTLIFGGQIIEIGSVRSVIINGERIAISQ